MDMTWTWTWSGPELDNIILHGLHGLHGDCKTFYTVIIEHTVVSLLSLSLSFSISHVEENQLVRQN